MTNKEKLYAIHRFVRANGKKTGTHSGYEVLTRHIGVCPVSAYICDEGWTKGITCPDLIHAYYTDNGMEDVAFSLNGEETLDSLYKLMTEGI